MNNKKIYLCLYYAAVLLSVFVCFIPNMLPTNFINTDPSFEIFMELSNFSILLVFINVLLVTFFTILLIKGKINNTNILFPIIYIVFTVIILIICVLFNNKLVVPYIHYSYYIKFILINYLLLNLYSLLSLSGKPKKEKKLLDFIIRNKKNLFLIGGLLIVFLVLGIVIYYKINHDNNAFIDSVEHIISIKSNEKKIEANTGSFCYEKACIDKVNFQQFRYDVITSYYGNKLYIDNLDGSINSVEVFNDSTKEFMDTKVYYTNEYIITPSINGPYIFKINAIYQGKAIAYYFMVNISKSSGEEIVVKMKLKEGTLTEKGLTMVVTNLSDKNLSYGNPYTIEKYNDGFWKTFVPINDVVFTLPAYELKINDSVELSINWEYGYGNLKGKYRVVKSFSYNENDNYISFNKYLEFEIE